MTIERVYHRTLADRRPGFAGEALLAARLRRPDTPAAKRDPRSAWDFDVDGCLRLPRGGALVYG
jgi:hypothetical protein